MKGHIKAVVKKAVTIGSALFLISMPAAVHADILYVGNVGNGEIVRFTSNGAGSVFGSGVPSAKGLAFDSTGNLYVAADGNNTIVKFTPGGARSVFASSGLNKPSGLAFDSDGNLYAANSIDSTIEKFTTSGAGSVFASDGVSTPFGLVFDRAGNLYGVNTGDTIEKFSIAGGVLTGSQVFVTGLNLDGAIGLAFDSAGNLYVANNLGNTVEKFDVVSGEVVRSGVFARGLNGPVGLAFDSVGDLYVANQFGNTIERFSPTGIDLGVFAKTGLSMPSYLAFTDDAGHPLPLANQVHGSAGPEVHFSEATATYPTTGALDLDAGATVTAPPGTNWQGGSLEVRLREVYSPNVDSLDLVRTNVPGQVSVQPVGDQTSAISLDGVEFASADFQEATLTVSFTKPTGAQAVQALLRSLVFRNTAFNLLAASAYDFPDREVDIRLTSPFQPPIAFTKIVQFPHLQGSLSQAMLYSLRNVLRQTSKGSVLLDSLLPYTAEMASLVVTNLVLLKEMQGVATNFQPVLSAVLSGQSATTTITQSQVDQLQMAWTHLGDNASPALQSARQSVQQNVGGFQQFAGQTVAQSSALLGITVPQQAVFYALKPELRTGQFSVQANVIFGLKYFLRRTFEVQGPVWEPVTNANVTVDGSTVTLIDTNAPGPHVFYEIGARNSTGASAE